MTKDQAKQLVRATFTHSFKKEQFRRFMKELVNRYDEGKAKSWNSQYIPNAFKDHVDRYERLGTFTAAGDAEKIDILIVHLTSDSKLERTRTALRNFVAYHLNRDEKDSGLVAFVSPSEATWRFSFVKMEYVTQEKAGRVSVATHLTPARRFSYLVGEGESCHTAQSRFLSLLQNTSATPTNDQIADCFSIETVTKDFFTRYYGLFKGLKQALDVIVGKQKAVRDEFRSKHIDSGDFAKKLLGQVVFLYFIQKKGWLGVAKGEEWGSGPRDFLRRLAKGENGNYKNLFNDVLEPLFYDTLATDRGGEAWCNRFKCRIPFLNGGLFEPLSDYNWQGIDLTLPNDLFFNSEANSEGDIGTGILDVFDRYNFTVNEAEPLEQEVAIDPEMLGKVFENLLEAESRKSLGTFYTPREIVHYMCQESLISYLYRAVNTAAEPLVPGKALQEPLFGHAQPVQAVLTRTVVEESIARDDLAALVHLGDQAAHYETALKAGTTSYEKKVRPRLPTSIETHVREIDTALCDIAVCDPAIGSGAFPVGMMTEIIRARVALNPYFGELPDRTAYHFKRHAIQSCIYGVDIDHGAVDIAKLRLWLSLVVDEENLKTLKPLPNLDYKVVSGNSLLNVEKNLFNNALFQTLEALKPLYFDESDTKKKEKLKAQIEALINEITASRGQFDFEVYFSEIFHRNQGFDIVIGNPPYGIVFDVGMKDRLQKLYASFRQNSDVYTAFFERGIQLLRTGGDFAFITPNTYLNGDYFKALRLFLSSSTVVRELTDYKQVPVFDDPTVFVAVLLCSRRPPVFPYDARLRIAQTSLSDVTEERLTFVTAGDAPFKPTNSLLARLQSDPRLAPLDELFFVKDVGFNYWTTGRGKKRGDNSIGDRVFYSGPQKDKRDVPFVKGRDVFKWRIAKSTNFLKHDYERLLDPEKDTFRFSAAFMEKRPKVIYRQTSNNIIAAIDRSGRYLDKTVHLIIPRAGWEFGISENVLVGLLNSSLFSYLYSYISQETEGRAFAQVKTTYIKKLPVPRKRSVASDKIEKLVEEILAEGLEEKREKLEARLNEAVCQLYQIMPEEKALLKGNPPLS